MARSRNTAARRRAKAYQRAGRTTQFNASANRYVASSAARTRANTKAGVKGAVIGGLVGTAVTPGIGTAVGVIAGINHGQTVNARNQFARTAAGQKQLHAIIKDRSGNKSGRGNKGGAVRGQARAAQVQARNGRGGKKGRKGHPVRGAHGQFNGWTS